MDLAPQVPEPCRSVPKFFGTSDVRDIGGGSRRGAGSGRRVSSMSSFLCLDPTQISPLYYIADLNKQKRQQKTQNTEYSQPRGSESFCLSACHDTACEIWHRIHGGVRLPTVETGKLRHRGCQDGQGGVPNVHFSWDFCLFSQIP